MSDGCIFCDGVCVCEDARPVRRGKAKLTKPTVTVQPTILQPAPVAKPSLSRALTPEEVEFNVSLQTLAECSMLDGEVIREYSHVLKREPTHAERLEAWRRKKLYYRG